MSEEASWWVDANVLLRFLTNDPPELAERASRLLEKAERDKVPLRVHSVVVAEIVWVLQSFYGRSKGEISGALIPLLEHRALRPESAGDVIRALETMTSSNVDFADALLAGTARSQGGGVASFDKDFRKLDVQWREPD
ncbi:PIN domain-containing protein [Rubrobacter tropicus]|uniref:Ribonuclease VapC n=1 Tax=Rubrobacter tropicus TaxID=2653851 RepID=A0A6G8Q4A6_9ACTN|nr:type II toxin-antitoxin system VapC family toxin [Rubrobacter tropicus]QIN81311.1 PIN domain-containing protein [Rubrobacter tropicus]